MTFNASLDSDKSCLDHGNGHGSSGISISAAENDARSLRASGLRAFDSAATAQLFYYLLFVRSASISPLELLTYDNGVRPLWISAPITCSILKGFFSISHRAPATPMLRHLYLSFHSHPLSRRWLSIHQLEHI